MASIGASHYLLTNMTASKQNYAPSADENKPTARTSSDYLENYVTPASECQPAAGSLDQYMLPYAQTSNGSQSNPTLLCTLPYMTSASYYASFHLAHCIAESSSPTHLASLDFVMPPHSGPAVCGLQEHAHYTPLSGMSPGPFLSAMPSFPSKTQPAPSPTLT